MTNDDFSDVEALTAAWTTNPGDLVARVNAAIDDSNDPLRIILGELRALRDEVAYLRATTTELRAEVSRLRRELPRPPVTRITPFAPSEGLVRLS